MLQYNTKQMAVGFRKPTFSPSPLFWASKESLCLCDAFPGLFLCLLLGSFQQECNL